MAGLNLIDHKPAYRNASASRGAKRLFAHRPSTIVCQVRKGSVKVIIDGKAVIDWEGKPSSLSLPPDWETPDKRVLFLGSCDGYQIASATLKVVSGRGKRLR